jgi:hypothetical protein
MSKLLCCQKAQVNVDVNADVQSPLYACVDSSSAKLPRYDARKFMWRYQVRYQMTAAVQGVERKAIVGRIPGSEANSRFGR